MVERRRSPEAWRGLVLKLGGGRCGTKSVLPPCFLLHSLGVHLAGQRLCGNREEVGEMSRSRSASSHLLHMVLALLTLS